MSPPDRTRRGEESERWIEAMGAIRSEGWVALWSRQEVRAAHAVSAARNERRGEERGDAEPCR